MAVSDEGSRFFARLADPMARMMEPPKYEPVGVSEARVVAVHDDGKIDVEYKGAVLTVPATTACDGVAEDDTALLTRYGAKMCATGVLSTGNPHYVSGECRIVTGSKSFEWRSGSNLHVFMSGAEYEAVAGRPFDSDRDFVGIMNGAWGANSVVPAGAIYNDVDGNLYCSFLTAPKKGSWVRVNYLLAIAFEMG